MAEHPPPPPPVVFCHESPKRVLVSVIRTTPIKPVCGGGGEPEPPPPLVPTSPGFSDFMVYPWRWGENAHNVTLSPGAAGAASAAPPAAAAERPGPRGRGAPPPAASGGEDEEEASSPDGGPLKVSAGPRPVNGRLPRGRAGRGRAEWQRGSLWPRRGGGWQALTSLPRAKTRPRGGSVTWAAGVGDPRRPAGRCGALRARRTPS